MPITTAYETKIERISILDEKGNFDEKLGHHCLITRGKQKKVGKRLLRAKKEA